MTNTPKWVTVPVEPTPQAAPERYDEQEIRNACYFADVASSERILQELARNRALFAAPPAPVEAETQPVPFAVGWHKAIQVAVQYILDHQFMAIWRIAEDIRALTPPIEPTSHAQGAPGEAAAVVCGDTIDASGYGVLWVNGPPPLGTKLYTAPPESTVSAEAVAWEWKLKIQDATDWTPCSRKGYEHFSKSPDTEARALGVIIPIEGTAARSGAEPDDRVGVHTSHCCAVHGCKYCNERCPVVMGTHKQEYPCEYCASPEPQPPANTERHEVSERERALLLQWAVSRWGEVGEALRALQPQPRSTTDVG